MIVPKLNGWLQKCFYCCRLFAILWSGVMYLAPQKIVWQSWWREDVMSLWYQVGSRKLHCSNVESIVSILKNVKDLLNTPCNMDTLLFRATLLAKSGVTGNWKLVTRSGYGWISLIFLQRYLLESICFYLITILMLRLWWEGKLFSPTLSCHQLKKLTSIILSTWKKWKCYLSDTRLRTAQVTAN